LKRDIIYKKAKTSEILEETSMSMKLYEDSHQKERKVANKNRIRTPNGKKK
jgi:hypothetical protein